MINKRRSRRRYNEEAVELNITAFLNLMVILIPFLLITAVFSKLAILELNLPSATAAPSETDTPSLNLELVIRESTFDIQDANVGLIRRFQRNPAHEDWRAFSKLLVEIKSLYPKEERITLLLEPGIPYKTLIKVMDRVKGTESFDGGESKHIVLFPTISISDASELSLEPVDQNEQSAEEAGLVQ